MGISVSVNTNYVSAVAKENNKSEKVRKPVWNANKVYRYLEDMEKGFREYRAQATAYYKSEIKSSEKQTMTADELKKQIQEWFPQYTLTDTEPGSVVQGKYYLYIDASNLQKMADDPDYRARVYGLMDSELQGSKGYTLQYSDGRNVTSHLTGSVFSLSDANRKYDCGDGIPYHGSCTGDNSFSTSESHPQVRSMSYLYDHADPVKSAAKARKSQAGRNAARLARKQKEKKAEEKRAEEKRAEDKKEQKEAEERKLEQEYIYGQSAGAMFDRRA